MEKAAATPYSQYSRPINALWELSLLGADSSCDNGQMLLTYIKYGLPQPTAQQLVDGLLSGLGWNLAYESLVKVLPVADRKHVEAEHERRVAIQRAESNREAQARQAIAERERAEQEKIAANLVRQEELRLAAIFRTGSPGSAFSAGVSAERARNFREAAMIYNRLVQLYPDSPHALEANKRLIQLDASVRAAQQAAGAALMGPVCESERRKFLAAGQDPGFTCN